LYPAGGLFDVVADTRDLFIGGLGFDSPIVPRPG
jgi:hypothetical protein